MAGAPRQTTIDAPKAVLRFDFREQLDQVTLPTLVLAGSRDRSVKPEHTQALADGIPQARLQRFPGAGHLVVLERAHQIAGASPSSRPVAPKLCRCSPEGGGVDPLG
jgi:pimeloyl-ACP methyl ester carboxylesterase